MVSSCAIWTAKVLSGSQVGRANKSVDLQARNRHGMRGLKIAHTAATSHNHHLPPPPRGRQSRASPLPQNLQITRLLLRLVYNNPHCHKKTCYIASTPSATSLPWYTV